MKTFVGIGEGTCSQAVEQATKDLMNPSYIILFADYTNLEEASKLLMKKYPGIDVMGIAGSMYYDGTLLDTANQLGRKKNDGLEVVAFFDDVEVRGGVYENLDGAAIMKLRKMDEQLKSMNVGGDNSICIAFPTDYEEIFVSSTKPLLNKYKMKMMGGSIGGFFGKGEEAYVMYNAVKYYHAAGYVFIKNKTGKIKIFRQDIYVKDGEDTLTITKVKDTSSRTFYEVNGTKMEKIYSEKYNINSAEMGNNLAEYTIANPIAAIIGDEHYVISMADKSADGGIFTFKKVTEGEAISCMKMGDYEKMEKDLVDRMKREMPRASFVFSVDCLYRAIAYTGKNYIDTYFKGMASVGKHVGLIGVGEQNEVQHFNQTMICAVFE